MDRRKFLEKGLFATGGLSLAGKKAFSGEIPAPAESKPSMKYRTLGRTGLRVSEVCFGTFGWQNTQVLEVAIQAGINLICTCADYQNGGAERAIAPAVAKHRDRVFILSGIDCMHNPGEQKMLERLDKSLETLGTDYLDLYVPHQADPVGARRRVASDEEDRYTHGRRYGFLNHPDPNSDPCHLPGGKRVPPA